MAKLNPKQERFCLEYIKDLNGTQAAIRAGYSAKTATPHASRLLTDVNVQRQISELKTRHNDDLIIEARTLLEEMLCIAKTDIADLYDEKGNLKHIHDIPEKQRRAIASIEVFEEFEGFGQERHKTGEIRKIRMWDKQKSLDSLKKHVDAASMAKAAAAEKHQEKEDKPTEMKLVINVHGGSGIEYDKPPKE